MPVNIKDYLEFRIDNYDGNYSPMPSGTSWEDFTTENNTLIQRLNQKVSIFGLEMLIETHSEISNLSRLVQGSYGSFGMAQGESDSDQFAYASGQGNAIPLWQHYASLTSLEKTLAHYPETPESWYEVRHICEYNETTGEENFYQDLEDFIENSEYDLGADFDSMTESEQIAWITANQEHTFDCDSGEETVYFYPQPEHYVIKAWIEVLRGIPALCKTKAVNVEGAIEYCAVENYELVVPE